MRIFKTKWFARYARQEGIKDGSLIDAIQRAEKGNIAADLGGGLIKQRVARQGRGRSSGYRVLIAYRVADRSVFIFGFAKNERDNIDEHRLESFKEIAGEWLETDEKAIENIVRKGFLQEVNYDDKKQKA